MKMFERLPLRARLFLLVAALVLGVLITSTIGFFFIEEHLEGMEVQLFLEQEADKVMQQLDAGKEVLSVAAGVVFYSSADAPPGIRTVEPDRPAEVVVRGRDHAVVARQWRDEVFYVVMPENEIEQLEVRVFILFSAWVFVLTSIALFIAYRMSARLVEPVSQLADQVEKLSPTDRGIRLAPQFRGEEVERIARAIDQYQQRLEGFVEREQSFTSSTSHELRTPLAIISGAAEILADTNKIKDSQQAKAIERIRRAAAEMNQFIDALLALSRASETDQYRAETDVAQILRPVLEDLRDAVADDVRLDCECDGALQVTAPPALVHIVVSNLLRNAVRHARGGSVRVRCTNREFEVADNGAGMSDEVLQHAFERHFSGGQGAGIGLYLVKRICDQFDWQIDLTSAPGRGTTAVVRFY